MSNTELTKYYMGLQLNTNKMPEVAYADIIPALDKHFNGQWTWELADERFAQDNTTVCTTVTVYVPGRVYTGRSVCKIKDYASNHLFAILDACQTFIEKNLAQPQQTQPTPASQQMTPDQIMNALGQQPQQQQSMTPPPVQQQSGMWTGDQGLEQPPRQNMPQPPVQPQQRQPAYNPPIPPQYANEPRHLDPLPPLPGSSPINRPTEQQVNQRFNQATQYDNDPLPF